MKNRYLCLSRGSVIADAIAIGLCLFQAKRLIELARLIDFTKDPKQWLDKESKEEIQGIASRAYYVGSGIANQLGSDTFEEHNFDDGGFEQSENQHRPDDYVVAEYFFEDD